MTGTYEVWDQSGNTRPFLWAETKHRDQAVRILHDRRDFVADKYEYPMHELEIDIYLVYREEDC